MKIIELDQRTQAWNDFRREGIGSSEIGHLLGHGPKDWKTIFDEKLNGTQNNFKTWQMQNGINEEPRALQALQIKENPNLKPVCAIHDKHSIIRASFDAYSPDGIFEIKTPSTDAKFEDYISGNIPESMKDQVRWQMLVADQREGYLVFWTGNDYILKKIAWDKSWEDEAIEVACSFWEHIEKLEPPMVIKDVEKEKELKDYLERKEVIKHLEKQNEESLQKIVANQSSSFYLGHQKVTLCPGRNSFNYKKMVEDFSIDSSIYQKIGKPFWQIR